jgi:hypothetical protein
MAGFSGGFTMSEHSRDSANGIGDDVGPEESNGELIHWMQPKPLTVGPAGLSAAAAGAFALGVAVAIAVLTLMHLLGPERQGAGPRRWRFRSGA